MTTLSSALNYALSGLSVSSARSALLSRNVSFAGDENYTRKSTNVISLPGGGAWISGINRSTDRSLLDKLLNSSSVAAGKTGLLDSLNRMAATIGDPADQTSLPAMLGNLQRSLKAYEANPASVSLASSAIETSRALIGKFNGIAAELQDIRTQADAGVGESVDHINSLLAQFKVVNDTIVRGTGSADELAESLDQRDSILKLLSDEIGIRTTTRSDNDILIYAEGGAVLFEGTPRAVKFAPSGILESGKLGNAVYIDGVPVTGPGATMPVKEGKLAAQSGIRDNLAVSLENQVDFLASSLVRLFAETDQSDDPTSPAVAGLFVDKGGLPLPVEGTTTAGLASRIAINPLADPGAGGDPLLIRDGGFGGPAYVYNKGGYPSFQDRISELSNSFDVVAAFDSGAGLGNSGSLKTGSVEAAAWIESQRQITQTSSDTASAYKTRASEALLRVTGVNLDDEMAALLDLEKAYQASSKIISVVDGMLASLLEAVR